jgi:hypothetical protein
MRSLRIVLVGCLAWALACGDDDADPGADAGDAAAGDAAAHEDAGGPDADGGLRRDAGMPVTMPDRCLAASELTPAPGPSLPDAPPGTACVDVGEPFSARCDGAWCLDAPRTPFPAPVAIGGSSSRDVWLLDTDGSLAHLGCNGWTVLPDPLPEFPRCTTPARFDDCTESRRDDEDDDTPDVGTCGAFCRFAVRSPSDAWLSNSEGPLYHFDGASWTRVEPPEGLLGANVWHTADGQLWLTGGAAQPGRAFRRDGDQWIEQTGGVFAGLDAPVMALAANRAGNVWASVSTSDDLLRFDGERWSWIETGAHLASSLLVLEGDEVWLGVPGRTVKRWAGGVLEEFTAEGDVVLGAPDEVWAFPTSGSPQSFDGERFRARPHPRAENDFVYAGFDGRMWVTDRTGAVSTFERDAWRFALDGDDLSTVFVRALHAGASSSLWAIGEGGEILRRDPAGWRQLHSLELASAPQWADPCCSPDTPQALFVRADDDAWFFGERGLTRSVLSHWDGQCFREHNLDDQHVSAFYAAAPDAAWAVGYSIFAWDGVSWTEHDVLSHLQDEYLAVTVWGTGADDVWVGGGELLNIDPGGGLPSPWPIGWIARWDGAAWSFLALPEETGMVHTITGRGASDVWVLTDRTVLFWDGTAFNDVTPAEALEFERLLDTTLLVPSDDGGAILCREDLALVWSGETWNADPDLPPSCPNWAPSLDDLWSVRDGQAFYLRR